jgi:imidazoleglycerol-phosphate dehydratase
MSRISKATRNTAETKINVELNLDGAGKVNIDTGHAFFDHMLHLFAAHGKFDLDLSCRGDHEVDAHHSVEDIGIVLGRCISAALGDKVGIKRYASVTIPMDETLATVSIDLSGRPYLVYNAEKLSTGTINGLDAQLFEEFFRAISVGGGITLHVNVHYGTNYHHMAESIFKAFARALKKAVKIVSSDLPSTKKVLD